MDEYYSDEEDDIRYLGSGDESEEVFEDSEKLAFEANGKTLYPYFAYTLSWDWDIEGENFKAEIDTLSIEITDEDGNVIDYEPSEKQLEDWARYLESKSEKATQFFGNWRGW